MKRPKKLLDPDDEPITPAEFEQIKAIVTEWKRAARKLRVPTEMVARFCEDVGAAAWTDSPPDEIEAPKTTKVIWAHTRKTAMQMLGSIPAEWKIRALDESGCLRANGRICVTEALTWIDQNWDALDRAWPANGTR